jgi:hypothetical protein
LSDDIYENILVRVVDPKIVAAWTECEKNKGGFIINGKLNGTDLVLEFRFIPIQGVGETKLSEDPVIAGAKCEHSVKKGTVVNNGTKLEKCTRLGTAAVTVVANSNVGGAEFFIPAVVQHPDISNALLGNYQVRLGAGGGCGGGAPNSFPEKLASIGVKNGALSATNECGDESAVHLVDDQHGYWWGVPITIKTSGATLITEDRLNGNSWVKVQR